MSLRLSSDWMTLADERILEYLDSEGTASPEMIAGDARVGYNRKYVNQRLWKLTEAGLTQKVGRGIYRITDRGRDYLSGEADLRDLPEPG